MPKVLKLQKEPLGRRAVEAIRDAIFAGDYLPGERMVEEELAASLGVSRNVVREAFWQIEAQGLIQSDDYKGKSVAALSPEKMAELVPLRLMMESLAAIWAARHVNGESASMLRAQVDKFAAPLVDYTRYAEVDFELHHMIWILAGNRQMTIMLDRIAGPMIALQVRVYQPSFPEVLNREHRHAEGSHQHVVEAICSGIPSDARSAMQKHLLALWEMWLVRENPPQEQLRRWQQKVDDTIRLMDILVPVLEMHKGVSVHAS